MTDTKKRKLSLRSGTVDIGCNCRKSIKLFSFLRSKCKVTSASSAASSAAASSSSVYRPSDGSNYSLRCLLDAESAVKAPPKPVKGFGRIDDEGIAVEKDSEDPYLDFRHSMLQMILENGIYTKDDMKELLNCFLQLNSPYYHSVIVRAFTDIWNGVFSVRSSSPAAVHHHYPSSASPAANNNNSFNSPYGRHYYNHSSASPAANNNNRLNSPFGGHYYNPSSTSPAAKNNCSSLNSTYCGHYYNPSSASPTANNNCFDFNNPYGHYYNPSWH